MRFRIGVGRLGLILLGLVFGLFFFEILGRVGLAVWVSPEVRLLFQHVAWPIGKTPALLEEDPDLGLRVVPELKDQEYFFAPGGSYHVSTVSLGFSGIGFRTRELANPPYAVVVGDSHTFCTSVEEEQCWVRILEGSIGLPVANLGIPGTGSISHQDVVERYALSLRPRIIIWQFTTNDPLDDLTLIQKRTLSGARFLRVRHWLLYHSILYNLQIAVRQTVFPALLFRRQMEQRFYSRGDAHFWLPRKNWSTEGVWSPEYIAGWRLTQDALLQTKRMAEREGVKLVVVTIPYKEEVYRDAVKTLFPDAKLLPLKDRPSEQLGEFLRANQIAYLDTSHELAKHAERDEQLYQVEVHLNPHGNRVLAAIVEGYLRSQNLLYLGS